jgi:hypothetical protein
MPIDLLSVNWIYVGVLAVFVFIATFVGNLLSFNHRGWAAFLSALAFVVIFIFWTYYPHGLPLPITVTPEQAATAEPAGMPSAPASPQKPRNPVTDITPPKNPVTTITPPQNPGTTITPPNDKPQ